jgi:putative FmdB family regulatory protein
MPNYNYTCKSCGHVQIEFRAMSKREKDTSCNKCESKSKHSLSVPSLILTLPEDRWANEHEALGNGIRGGV